MSTFPQYDIENPCVVYSVPHEKWFFRSGDGWALSTPVGKPGAIAHLQALGWDKNQAQLFMKTSELHVMIHSIEMRPGAPMLFRDEATGYIGLNLYRAPALVPREHPHPTIAMVRRYLCRGDATAEAYFDQSLARRVQNLDLLPKMALVFATNQGAGKGFMFRVMSEILGADNCATVTQAELESRFFGENLHKLLILGDEVTSSENIRDISQKLKVYIDGGTLQMEKKYENALPVRNRMMWMFASNDPVSPLVLEGSDRRYSFFSNFDPVPPEYTAALAGCFAADRTTLTAAFKEEIAGYAHYLLNLPVDVDFVSKPLKNEARTTLIDANRPSHETFCAEVDANGIEAVAGIEVSGLALSEPWDFGPEIGVAFGALYKMYRQYCKDTGQHALRANKFGAAVKNRQPAWPRTTHAVDGKRVICYAVPRRGQS